MKAIPPTGLTSGVALVCGAMVAAAAAPADLTPSSRREAVTRVLIEFSAASNPTGLGDPRAGPVKLTASQMDEVTAGLAAVDVATLAMARGPAGYTSTDTQTRAVGRDAFELAYGLGDAYAVGEATEVAVSTSFYSDGEVVVGERFAFTFDAPSYSEGHTGGFVVSVDPDHPWFDAIHRTAERLAGLLRRDSERFRRHAEHARAHLERNPERGPDRLATLASRVGRDYDRLEHEFQRGIRRLLLYDSLGSHFPRGMEGFLRHPGRG